MSASQQDAAALADALRKLLAAIPARAMTSRPFADACANAEAVIIAYEAPPFLPVPTVQARGGNNKRDESE